MLAGVELKNFVFANQANRVESQNSKKNVYELNWKMEIKTLF